MLKGNALKNLLPNKFSEAKEASQAVILHRSKKDIIRRNANTKHVLKKELDENSSVMSVTLLFSLVLYLVFKSN